MSLRKLRHEATSQTADDGKPIGRRFAKSAIMTTASALNARRVPRTSRDPRCDSLAFVLATVPLAAAPLPHNIPDFSYDQSRTTVRSVQSGQLVERVRPGRAVSVPTANQVVHVDPGHVVTIDDTAAVAYTIAVHGTLRFNPAANTRLTVTNLMVMGDHGMPSMTTVGYLEVGTAATPIPAGRHGGNHHQEFGDRQRRCRIPSNSGPASSTSARSRCTARRRRRRSCASRSNRSPGTRR